MPGNFDSYSARISRDGARAFFVGYADDLLPEDTNNAADVFMYEIDTDSLSLVSVRADGVQSDRSVSFGSISSDGRLVAFQSRATNLVANHNNGTHDCFVKDVTSGFLVRVSLDADGQEIPVPSSNPRLSGNGNYGVIETSMMVWSQTTPTTARTCFCAP